MAVHAWSPANCPPLDLLCAPGGSYGVVRAIGDREIMEFVRRQAGAAKYVTSVCRGFECRKEAAPATRSETLA